MFRHHGHWSSVTRFCFSRRAFALLGATVAYVVWVSAKPPAPQTVTPEAAQSATEKFERIGQAHDSGDSFGTVQLTEHEANSYLAYELASDFPAGVSDIMLQFQPGRISGSLVVDFDKLKERMRTPPHPIAALFLRGVHTVGVEGSASGSDGIGEFRLERVLLDGVELPQMVVDFMIEQFVRPRYPNAAINRPFELPYSIDSFRAGTGYVVLTGKASR